MSFSPETPARVQEMGRSASMDDIDRLRDLAHRLWIAEGRPDLPRHELMRRASDILARQEKVLREAAAREGLPTSEVLPFPSSASES
jgi:hypothetical protein